MLRGKNNNPRYLSRIERERREKGLCQMCGGTIDSPGPYYNCKKCRTIVTEKSRERKRILQEREKNPAGPSPNELWAREKMRREAEQAIQAERFKQKIQKCLTCEWARIDGNIIFCPFAQGICQKGDYSLGKKNPDQGQWGENPI